MIYNIRSLAKNKLDRKFSIDLRIGPMCTKPGTY